MDGTQPPREIAEADKINPSYVSRVLRLTLFPPVTVNAISEGRHPLTLAESMALFPVA